MAIFNRVTGERTYIGLIISERGTFRLDTSMDEVVVWNVQKQHAETIYLGQGDEHVERGQDLSPENLEQYNQYTRRQHDLRMLANADRLVRTLAIGSTIRVVHGRNVPTNTIGVVNRILKASKFIQLVFVDKEGVEFKTYARNIEMQVNGEFTDEFND